MRRKRQHLFTADLPHESGCYIIRGGGLIVYVGMSKCLHNRWFPKDGYHHRYWFIKDYFPDATIEYILYPESELKERERELIKKLKPIVNHNEVSHAIKKYNLIKTSN